MEKCAGVRVLETELNDSPGARAAEDPLIEQATVQIPEKNMKDQSSFAVGLIETQGFTAVFEAIDTALKTAAVEVLAREKLGAAIAAKA